MHIDASSAECAVVNEQIIREGIQSADGELIDEERRRSMAFAEVKHLSLGFRNLVSMAHLNTLSSLTKLQLDNNHIKRIKHLDGLIHLRWLDLSFNQIEKIEGLEKLKHLTDLSLFQNRIERIENLESLHELQILSLGNNSMAGLENIDELRRFKNLRILVLSGNPVSQVNGFRSYLLSRLGQLKSLDYELLLREEIAEAKERHQDAVLEIEERENKNFEQTISEESSKAEQESLVAANLADLDDYLKRIKTRDHKWEKLYSIPGLADVWNEMHDKARYVMKTLIAERNSLGEIERSEKEQSRKEAGAVLLDRQEKSRQRISQFERLKKNVMGQKRNDDASITDLKFECTQLKTFLINTEEDVMETMKKHHQTYETLLRDHADKALMLTTTHISQMQSLFSDYDSRMRATMSEAVKRSRLHLKDDAPNRETLESALEDFRNESARLMEDVEKDSRNNIDADLNCSIGEMHLQEKRRERDRLAEILNYISRNTCGIDDVQVKSD